MEVVVVWGAGGAEGSDAVFSCMAEHELPRREGHRQGATNRMLPVAACRCVDTGIRDGLYRRKAEDNV